MDTESFQSIGQIIQLSVAPVFLLMALGSFIGVATTRLGRVVDRARFLEIQIKEDEKDEDRKLHVRELAFLDRRIWSINLSVMFGTFAALMVCAVVIVLFVSALLSFDASFWLAILFILAMGLLVTAFGFFMVEILTASRSVRVRSELLKSE